MTTVLFFLLTSLFGWFLINLCQPTLTKLEHLGLSLFVGAGSLSVIYYLFTIHLQLFPVSTTMIQLAILTCLTGLLISLSRRHYTHVLLPFRHLSLVELGLIIIVILSLSYTLLQIFYWPPYNPDAIYLYDFRALRLINDDIAGFYSGAKYLDTIQYPPFTSLLHTFMYQTGRTNSGVFYGIFYLAFFLTLYGYVARITRSHTRAIITLTALAITPTLLWNSFLSITNIIYMEYVVLAVLYFTQTKPQILLSGILLAFSAWVRSEILWLVILIPLGWAAYKSHQFKVYLLIVALTTLTASIWISTQPVNISPSIPQIVVEKNSVTLLLTNKKVQGVAKPAIALVGRSLASSWSLIFPFYLAIIILEINRHKKLSALHFPTLSIVVALGIGFILKTTRYQEWVNLSDAVYRMGIVAIPLFWVGIITSKVWDDL